MRYCARIRFQVQATSAYESKKIYKLFNKGHLICRYRYSSNKRDENFGTFEFVYGNFSSKKDAFREGKKLYFNLLYLLNVERLPFKLLPLNFNDRDTHHCGKIGGKEPEKFYFSNHDFYNDYLGLEVYELNDDFFKEYDNDESFQRGVFIYETFSTNHLYNFGMLENLNIEYDDDAYKVFELLDKTNRESNSLIQLLLLSICYERLSEIVGQHIKDKKNLSSEEMVLLEAIKTEKAEKKCRALIRLFCLPEYTKGKARKIFQDLYNIRSEFAHGSIFDEKNVFKFYNEAQKLFMVLFKNFMKEKYNG